jgi:hypothetical protein
MADLPNSDLWHPTHASETLNAAFAKRCAVAQELIRTRVEAERRMAIYNFDSGLPIEEIVRDQLSDLLPSRYSIRAGTVVDAQGFTAGDCDVVVFNDLWCPVIKTGPTRSSRHVMLPIEGVYAVGEVKQTLSETSLDESMKKLVKIHRLTRPHTFAHRIVENRESDSCTHGLTNPLFSFVLAFDVEGGITFEELINRFFDICRSLKRLEVIRALCVLGCGTVVWGFDDPLDEGSGKPALFMEGDLFHSIYPVYLKEPDYGPALYNLASGLLLHLFHAVLGIEDVPERYGMRFSRVKVPTDRKRISLAPDPEWRDRLARPCQIRSTT